MVGIRHEGKSDLSQFLSSFEANSYSILNEKFAGNEFSRQPRSGGAQGCAEQKRGQKMAEFGFSASQGPKSDSLLGHGLSRHWRVVARSGREQLRHPGSLINHPG